MIHLQLYAPQPARPYATISVEDDDDYDLLCTPLLNARVTATIIDHGLDAEEFWSMRAISDWNAPVTLKELRDWLGY